MFNPSLPHESFRVVYEAYLGTRKIRAPAGDLLPVSSETANKLLQGEFKTFEEFFEFSQDDIDRELNIEVLYRRVLNTNRDEDIYIIETIFINE